MKALLFLLWTLPATLLAQVDRATLQPVKVDVVYLASDYLEGRESGSEGEILAAEYIAHRFEKLGLKPAGTGGSWYQPFDFRFNTNPHAAPEKGESRTARNVVALLDNGAPTTVVIGAHYDHLGHGHFSSLAPNDHSIHNGADDNASGVAGLLYLAEQLQQSAAKANNYLFIAFSGEELGLFGSKHYVNNPTLDLGSVNYMLNMDMIGRLGQEKSIAISGTGTSPAWEKAFAEVKTFQVQSDPSGIGPSDHTSFYLKDLPVLHFFTGAHDDYHKPSDDVELVNFEGIVHIADYMVELIEWLDGQGKLAFTKTKDNSDKKAAKFKVTLGVMPDYAYSGEGMRVDAVIDGRPGQKAGLEDGDVIVKIGDMKVEDIYGYMEALSKYQSGDSAEVTVQRGKKKVTKKVTF